MEKECATAPRAERFLRSRRVQAKATPLPSTYEIDSQAQLVVS